MTTTIKKIRRNEIAKQRRANPDPTKRVAVRRNLVKDLPYQEFRDRKNAMDRERRRKRRESSKPDRRTREGRVKPHYSQSRARPAPAPPKRSNYDRGMKIKPVRRAESRFPTRTIPLSELIPVRIDQKTTVYVKPGTDIQATIAKYSSRRF